MMPLRVAMPKSVMKPIIEATLSTPPARNTPATPPISASGRLTIDDHRVARTAEGEHEQHEKSRDDADEREPTSVARRSADSRTGRRTRRDTLRASAPSRATRGLDVVDDAAQIAAGDVARNHDPPLHVLAEDHVRPLLAAHIGQQPNRHRAARRRVDRKIADALEISAGRRVELDHEIERRSPIEDPPDGCPREARLDGLGDIVGVQPVASDRRSVEHEADERDVHLLLERQVDDAGTPLTVSRTRSPSRRSVPRSSPNTLTAMLARVPDSM